MDHQNPSILFNVAQKYFPSKPDSGPCSNFNAAYIFCTIVTILLLITLSHFLHLVLKHYGQPRIISQMLAGFFLGPSILGHINLLNEDKTQLEYIASTASIFFMFLAGLEIDISNLRHTIRAASAVVVGNVIGYKLISILVSFILYQFASKTNNKLAFFIAIFLMLFNTSSTTLIRLINELKLTMTITGRVAISVALITDVLCLFIIGFLGFIGIEKNKKESWHDRLVSGIFGIMMWAIISFVIRRIVKRVNKQNGHTHVVGIEVVFYLLLLVFAMSLVTSFLSYDPMIGAFIFGLVIPKDGPTSRTLIEQLSQIVYNLILPIYFGVAALKVDINMLKFKEVLIVTTTMVIFGMLGKIGGIIAGAKYRGMTMHEGMVLSFLLNVRGHVSLIIISSGLKYGIWNHSIYMALLISLFLNSIIACHAITYIVQQRRGTIQYNFRSLECFDESELRMIACVHSPSDLPIILDLIEISNGSTDSHLVPYILHLIELKGTATSTMLYHQLQDSDVYNDMGNSQSHQVSAMIDIFVRQTSINLRRLNGISYFNSMYKDLQNGVQDIHASLAIIPFHRKQRFDGKMGIGKEDVRKFNINVLHHVPCSVGILVDRGMDKRLGGSLCNKISLSLSSKDEMKLNVVVLFLGGPDDREAAAYAGRLTLNSCVNLTMVRFLPTLKVGDGVHRFTNNISSTSTCVAMEIKKEDVDGTFMSNFYNRFVVKGIVTYVETMVQNSTELIVSLSSMKEMYSLYIMGRQIQGPAAQLIEGMSNWTEYPELGSIGDLLASSDFMNDGSVLVIQQCKETINTIG